MTSTKAKKSAKPATPASAANGLIVLGFDARQKPCGARFVNAKPALVVKAAQLSCEPQQAAVGPHPDKASIPAPRGLPHHWDEIAPGHLVIVQESPDYGWCEAIVLDRTDDMLTLQYRDYPKLPKFFRHRTAVALLSPPSE